MNKIEAIIRPDKLDVVKRALDEAGFAGLNVVPVTGRGVQKGVVGGVRGVGSYQIDMLPKIKLELVASDANTQKVVDVIVANARTGDIGDGKIFISPVADAIRVRTGEHGDSAL